MTSNPMLAVCGDLHGHLQLAACAWALEQGRCGRRFEAILACGDVGTFTDGVGDRATRRHARSDPSELEFRQWMFGRPWLDAIYAPASEGGLGLDAPFVMVTGNHEGFDHLESILATLRPGLPKSPVTMDELPAVDPFRRVLLLPSGWRVNIAGVIVGGVGGIQPGQRPKAGYPPLAYADQRAVNALLEACGMDVLISHQGPAEVHGCYSGGEIFDPLLQASAPFTWFHGHSRTVKTPTDHGRAHVVPLGDAVFATPGGHVHEDAWARCTKGADGMTVEVGAPRGSEELRRASWVMHGTALIAPHLAGWAA